MLKLLSVANCLPRTGSDCHILYTLSSFQHFDTKYYQWRLLNFDNYATQYKVTLELLYFDNYAPQYIVTSEWLYFDNYAPQHKVILELLYFVNYAPQYKVNS